MIISPYVFRGSVAGLADTKGHLTKTCQYTVTGELTFGSATYENEYTYNGESYNPNIHSQYLRARYYSVVTASFLTEDSYLGNIREPLTLNRYNYCVSSYLNYVDPSGNNPVMDVLSGVVATIYRNGTQMVAEPIAVLDMLYDGLAWNDWHGWHEYAEQANISAITFVEDAAASAENKTLYYIGNCAGDVVITLAGVAEAVKGYGAAIYGGSPGDPGIPVTHEDVLNGIRQPGGGTFPPAIQIR